MSPQPCVRGPRRHPDSPTGVWQLPVCLSLPFPGGDAPAVRQQRQSPASGPRGSFFGRRVPPETSAAPSWSGCAGGRDQGCISGNWVRFCSGKRFTLVCPQDGFYMFSIWKKTTNSFNFP